jgi:hypothetical protein
MFTLISGIIFPATPTAISTIAAFAVILPIIVAVLAFIFKLIRSG